MNNIIINNLCKVYGSDKLKAVDDVTFTVDEGELFGLIGPDGAGKTSIFRMLTTLLLPDGGNAKVCGYDIVSDYRKIRNAVGYMPGKFSLYQDLTVSENLEFFASVFNTTVEENYGLIHDIYVQIEPFKNRRAGKLSGGMKQKLALCCALIHKPEVLLLDEPTTGVDPVSRREFWQMLKKLKSQGITILVATPYMDEATMCDRIALIQNGKILDINTPALISASFPDKLFALRSGNTSALLKVLRSYGNNINAYAFGESVHVSAKQEEDKVNSESLLNYINHNGIENVEVKEVKASVEDCFIRLLK